MVAIVAALVMVTGCAKVPTPEIDQASAAIQEAVNEGASTYQTQQLTAVQDSLSKIMEQIEVQKSKLIPRYGDIKTKLGETAKMANQVTQSTKERKEEIRMETQKTLDEIKALIESNKRLVASAPKGKEGVAALEMINADIATIEQQMEEAGMMLADGDLMNANNKAKVAFGKAESIQNELKTVIEKSAKKNKK